MNVEKKLKELAKELKDQGDNEALQRLEELHRLYTGEDEIVSSLELEEFIKAEPPEYRMMTGLEELDNILEGFRPQQLITLTGITKHGKTTFAMDLVDRLKKEKPLVLPFEEPAKELIRKYHERDMEVPLFYTPKVAKDRSLDWIEDKIIESKAKYGTKIIFIDHLDYINEVATPTGENEVARVKHTMQALKDLAKQWDVIIVLLVHLKKVQLDRNPDLEDIRGSASISQESDTVMIMWRRTTRESGDVIIHDDATLSVQANRRTGKTGNVKLIFEKGRYRKYDPVDDDERAVKTLKQLEEVQKQKWQQLGTSKN